MYVALNNPQLIISTVYTTPASYVMFSMGSSDEQQSPSTTTSKPAKFKRQFGSKPKDYKGKAWARPSG